VLVEALSVAVRESLSRGICFLRYGAYQSSSMLNPPPSRFGFTVTIKNRNGYISAAIFVFAFASSQLPLQLGKNNLTCVFPALFLQTGTFYVSLYVVTKDNKCLIIEKDVISFLVSDGGRDFGAYMGREPGVIRPQFNWYLA
jgi:lipopolysaccharide transport system ATP-binding protein